MLLEYIPLAENYYGLTPYNDTDNNPVNDIDPNGMEAKSALREYLIGNFPQRPLDAILAEGEAHLKKHLKISDHK